MGENGAEITSLYIDVETNAEKAERQLAKLKDTIQSMKGSGSGADVTFSKVSQEAKKATAHTKGLLSQIARIGKMMLIRSALRGVVKAAKEGYQNLLLYSKAMNSADSAHAASTANAYASALTQCKNAAGAAIAPLAEALLPVIQTLAGWFIAAANAVNQFISALMGKTSYTKALGVAVDYVGGIEKGAGGANEAMKELKKTIMGFDEINALNDTSKAGGGGGSGGGGGGASVGDMFEEAEIDSSISKVADKVREVFQKIREYAEPVLNWIKENVDSATLIIAGLAGAIAALGGNFKVGVGIALSIVGLSMEYDAIKNIASGNGKLQDYIKAAIGGALGVAGALLVFGTGPVGWTIGLGAVLTIGIVAALDGSGKLAEIKNDLKETADYYQRLLDIVGNSEGIEQNTLDVLDRIRKAWDGVKESANNAALSEMYALQAEAILNAQAAVTQYDKALQEQKEAYEHLQEVQGRQPTLVRNAKKAYEEATEAVNVAEEALRNADSAVTEASNNIDIMRECVEKNSKTWDSFVANADGSETIVHDVYKNIQNDAMDTAGATEKFKDEAKKHLEEYGEATKAAQQRYETFQRELKMKSDSIVNDVNRVKKAFTDAKTKVDDLISSIKKNAQLDIKVRAAGDSKGGTQNTYQTRASGGYVDRGDIFVANEAGPELVGTINGRTAVASNGEITGITAAVNESSAREALLLNALINVANSILAKDNGGGGITTEQLVAAMNRQNRRDGTSTFAVAT